MIHISLIKHYFKPRPTPRLYFHKCGIIWEYKVMSTNFQNDSVDGQPWNIVDTWNVRIGFSRPLFERTDMRYDGHTVKGFTFLGIEFTRGYTYDSRPIKDKEAEYKEQK